LVSFHVPISSFGAASAMATPVLSRTAASAANDATMPAFAVFGLFMCHSLGASS